MPDVTPEEEPVRRMLAERSMEELIYEIEARVDYSVIILRRDLGNDGYDCKRACRGDRHILLGMCCEFQDWLLRGLQMGKGPAKTF